MAAFRRPRVDVVDGVDKRKDCPPSPLRPLRPLRPPCATSRGFSLIEALVAVVIFSIAIVGIIEGIAQSTRTQAWLESESRAAMLAQNILGEMEYVGEFQPGTPDGGQFSGDDTRYSWASETVETEFEGLYEVRVTVSWNEGGAARDFRLVTYLREQAYETEDELATQGTQPGTQAGAQTGGGRVSAPTGTNTR